MNSTKLLKAINNFKEENKDNKLYVAVANDLLDYADPEYLYSHIQDIITYGCVSGAVSNMIYYRDTEKFYSNYSLEILEELKEYEENCGCKPINDITANNLAWFGYETVVNKLNYYIEDIA